MESISTSIRYRLLSGFDDPMISPKRWNALLDGGSTDVVFLSWQWQDAWWEVFGRGKLLLLIAEDQGRPIAIAPFFADCGMVYFVGSGGSDYLDFIGKELTAEIITGFLSVAAENAPDFIGFCLYHFPENSFNRNLLEEAASIGEWSLVEEGGMPAPVMDCRKFPELVMDAARKKSLLRHENWFMKNGQLDILHATDETAITAQLEPFFAQHIERWRGTKYPSLFLDPKQRQFYHAVTRLFSDTGWLRFTFVTWNGQAIAYHFGFNYKGSFLWYKPCFNPEFAKHSPGEVLIRHLLLLAQKEAAHEFDFGLGDEAFKARFATHTRLVKNWGFYPLSTLLR